MTWRSPTAQTVGLRTPLQLRERAQELPPQSLGRKALARVRVGIHLVGGGVRGHLSAPRSFDKSADQARCHVDKARMVAATVGRLR
jgi:hypothetical protein